MENKNLSLSWYGFVWYISLAFFFISSTAKYLLIDSQRNNDFVVYIFIGMGIIIGIVHSVLLLRTWKNYETKVHLIFIISCLSVQIIISLSLAFETNDNVSVQFPPFFSFQILMGILTFITEIDYRKSLLGNKL